MFSTVMFGAVFSLELACLNTLDAFVPAPFYTKLYIIYSVALIKTYWTVSGTPSIFVLQAVSHCLKWVKHLFPVNVEYTNWIVRFLPSIQRDQHLSYDSLLNLILASSLYFLPTLVREIGWRHFHFTRHPTRADNEVWGSASIGSTAVERKQHFLYRRRQIKVLKLE